MPAAPNRSLIQAYILSVSRDARGLVLTIDVLSSEPQPGFADFGAKVVGSQIEAVVADDAGGTYASGQLIQGELSYRGDEHGGVYTLRPVSTP